jgi:flagellar biosynthesis/type III secretory pathway M-ring protein FliF/YscJ
VDLSSASGETAGTALTKQDIESLIKQTVGFDETRGDQIHVVTAPLLGTRVVETQMTVMDRWKLYENLARDVSLGIAALAALLIALLVLRRLRPPTLPESASLADLSHREQILAQLAQRARENPDTLRTVIAAWLQESETHRSGEARPRRAA